MAQTAAGQLRTDRAQLMEVDRLVALMDIRPGSTVLDVGAGYGLFTFALARAVGEGGTLVATDRDVDAVDYLLRRARSQNHANVVPVHTRSIVSFKTLSSIDPVYAKYSFDRILAADILPLVFMPENFFRELRPSLRPGDGRLWVVDLRLDPDFQAVEFPDLADLIRRLPPSAPGLTLLEREGVAIAAPDSETFRAAFLAALDRLLDDETLWAQAQSGRWPLNLREASIRQFLARHVEANSQPGATRPLPARRLLNRLILQDLFGTSVWERAFSLDTLQPAEWEPLLSWVTANQDYEALFRRAGYELQQAHDVLAYHYVFEFRRAD